MGARSRPYACAGRLPDVGAWPVSAGDPLEETVDWLVADSLAPLMTGTLVIRYRATAARSWAAYWEFSDEDSGATWHAVLVDDQGIDQLRPGEAREPERAAGGMGLADWLMQAKPQEAAELDFRVAMRIAKEQPVVFSVVAVS